MSFYLIAASIALITALLLVRPLVSGRRAAVGRDTVDSQVFRDQLAEIERDLARGTITPDEAEGARIEVSRRLLASDARAKAAAEIAPGPKGAGMAAAIVALIAVPAAGALLYVSLGAPGLPDQPLATRTMPADPERPTQEQAERMMADQLPPAPEVDPDYLALVARLEQVVEQRPDDPEGHRVLGDALLRVGRWVDAARSYDRHVELAETVAPTTLTNHAEAMAMAAGGYISPRGEMAIRRALELQPDLPMARYYAALALRQAGRTDDALQVLTGLRDSAPPGAPWLPAVEQLIAQTVDAATPGPSREQMDAAQEMTPEERAEMIAGMVARLEERLTTDGGTVEEWVRLVNAHVQLGNTDEALRVYGLGRAALADPGARGFLKEQALLLGLDVE